MKYLGVVLLSIITLLSCEQDRQTNLPILGHKHVENGDTVYHQIPDFSFVNQDSQIVTNQTFEGKIYLADFFFTSCPTICPVVKKQMLRIYDEFLDEKDLVFLSHSIDGRRDSVPRLKTYAENLDVTSDRWHFVTGNTMEIYEIADDYFSVAKEDPEAPGGYDHSGRIILVDSKRRVRSYCDGTDPEDVDRLMQDIKILLEEHKNAGL